MSSLSLWQIEDNLISLIDSWDTCPPDLRPELEERIAEYVTAEASKVDGVNHVLRSLEFVAQNAKNEIERLRERQHSAERNAERLKEYILRVLHARGGTQLRGANVTFYVRKTEAVNIVDPQLVPDQFRRETVTYDYPKDALRKAIKSGEQVPGVILTENEHLARR